MERNYNLDLLKGFAVIVMLFANTTPYFFYLDDNLYLRLFFSIAAPIFIISSGYITQKNIETTHKNKSKLYYRIFQILFFGVFIDYFCWHAIPFISFDVLYLIAFSQLFLLFINKNYLLFLTSILFILSILLHQNIEYRFFISELKTFSLNNFIDTNPLKRYFFDGWFPILPWLSFFLLGSLSSIFDKELIKFKFLFVPLGVFGFIIFIILTNNYIQPVRDNYLELWYPLNGNSLLIPMSVLLIFIGIINFKVINNKILTQIIIDLGKNTLFVYTINAIVISLMSDFYNKGFNNKLLFTFIIFAMILLTLLLQRFKSSLIWSKTPKFIKFILCN
jgi:hypothetical protein